MHKISHVYKSPNFDRRTSDTIDMLVIHATKMGELSSLERLCNPDSKVSCHYLISQNGDVYCLVDEYHRAWHAGISYWQGRSKLNNYSIGIELVNPDHNLAENVFTAVQMNALIEICAYLIKKYSIPDYNVVAHSDIAPDRKDDPGQYFHWILLAKHGIGFDYSILGNINKNELIKYGNANVKVLEVQKMLKELGYQIDTSGIFDQECANVIVAFKRHYYQQDLSLTFNNDAFNILGNILSYYRLSSKS